MALRVVTAPTTSLISLDDAKVQCRVDFDDDDALFQALIATAQDTVEAYVQRRYGAQTLEWVCDEWPMGRQLPIAGGQGFDGMEIESVTYADLTSGDATLLDPSFYWAKPRGQTLALTRRWFVVLPWLGDAAERVVVRFTVPEAPTVAAQHACKMLVSHWYGNREAVVGVESRDSSTEIPLGVQTLLMRERWELLDRC